MNDADKARRALGSMLELTKDEELDCDAFVDHLAALVEGQVTPQLAALMEHHRAICPECEEERALLAKALGLPE